MARYSGPSCRLCRREGVKLFLKGNKCISDKCPITKRTNTPGQHGRPVGKLSDYGLRLREKQKAKRIYGLLERQFHVYFLRASRAKGVTGEKLLELLERRLDNVIFRLCFANTRSQARQVVRHGYVLVNNKRVNIPSYTVKKGDVISIKNDEGKRKYINSIVELSKERGTPKWLAPDYSKFQGEVLELPKKQDVGFPIQEQLIVELYSK